MSIDAKHSSIGELAHLQAGFPFRGAIEADPEGSALAVQMKDVDSIGGINWANVIRADLPGRKSPAWLQRDDLLFVSRGTRFYAVLVESPPPNAVCGPHFLHFKFKAPAKALPGFVAWQMNQPPFQRQLQQAAEGSSQLSIRRPVLESMRLAVPSLADQQRILQLARLAHKERQALHQLIHNRDLQLEALAEELVSSLTS
jgi:hypothetical protein